MIDTKTKSRNLRMYIGGEWVDSEGGETVEAHNPATGEVISAFPWGTREDARRAIAAANENKHKIVNMSVWDRSKLLRQIGDVMMSRHDELAHILSLDQGKPLETEAKYEVSRAAIGFYEASEQIKWLETSVIQSENPNKRIFSFRQPRGVYAVITPWNYPINIPVEYIAPGLATGNAIVWVPAPTTTTCAIKLMECLEEAGVPAGVVNLVTGHGPVVGDEIVVNPGTQAIGMTGSPVTGRTIAERAPLKPKLLELGGNGPTVVLKDADLEKASAAIGKASFFNAGQICMATERLLVQRDIHDELLERLVEEAKARRLGDPLDPETTMGPLNNRPVAEKMDHHIADAVAKGAAVVYGGERAKGLGSDLFYQPTIIDNLPTDSEMNIEETFGPIVKMRTFESYEEALTIANQGKYGLVTAVFTNNMKDAFYFAEHLRSGIVNINDRQSYWELHIPFGGVSGTESGLGRLGGKHSMMEMTDLRTMIIDIE